MKFNALSKYLRATFISRAPTVRYIFYVFLGDHPELEFESGNAHGGTYPCTCGCSVDDFNDLAAMYKCKAMSLEDRRKKVRV